MEISGAGLAVTVALGAAGAFGVYKLLEHDAPSGIEEAARSNFSPRDTSAAIRMAQDSGRGADFIIGSMNVIGRDFSDQHKLGVLRDTLDSTKDLHFVQTVFDAGATTFSDGDKPIAAEDALFSQGISAEQIAAMYLNDIKYDLPDHRKIPYEQRVLGRGRDGR